LDANYTFVAYIEALATRISRKWSMTDIIAACEEGALPDITEVTLAATLNAVAGLPCWQNPLVRVRSEVRPVVDALIFSDVATTSTGEPAHTSRKHSAVDERNYTIKLNATGDEPRC
jgi:hypothetical protein